MTPEPLPFPDPSEASEMFSSLPASLLLPPKKDNSKPIALSMYTERPALSWALCLVPAKKNGRVELAEELEMREGTGLIVRGTAWYSLATRGLVMGGGVGGGVGRMMHCNSYSDD